MPHDLLIRGGTVIDGSGAPARPADVAIDAGRITAVGAALAGHGREEIDATGCLVTPGFVDIHTHYDAQATWSPRLDPSSAHGVTTVVMGNCGVGFAPCRPAARAALVRLMEGIEDIPEVVMTAGLPWAWESFPDYLDFLAARQYDVDVAAYLPHAALRVHAMGERGAAREAATAADLAAMQALAAEAVAAGAIGFATSRSINHRGADGALTPSYDAAEQELHAIAAGLRQAGRGVLQAITDFPSAAAVPERMGLLRRLVERSGRPLSFTLAQFHRSPHAWAPALALLEQARADGLPLRAQVFPRAMGMLMGWDTSRHPFSASARWQALAALPAPERLAALRHPAHRQAILDEARAAPGAGPQRQFEQAYPLRSAADYEPAPGSSVAARAAADGVAPDAWAYDALLADDGRGLLFAAFANLIDGDLGSTLAMLRSPATVLGLGDGGAHYGLLCDASYSTFALTHWGRDRAGERLPLPLLVRKLTREPALAVGLADRGWLAPGHRADLNVIDFAALQVALPQVRHDLPAGGRRLTQGASGYRATVVAGTVTRRDDQPTGALPGRLVRGAQPAPA